MSNLFQSTTIPILEQVVQFTQARHLALAGNVANASTPGYVARDLSVEDFESRLKSAIDQRRAAGPSAGAGEVITAGAETQNVGTASKNPKEILYHDQSQVGLEHQVTEMVKNRLDHNLALSIMVSQFRLLQAAISERA
jgi:flagellar basal-body rod protein FlgB